MSTGHIIALDKQLPGTPTEYIVETTSSYKKTGIYSATPYDPTESIFVDWGDGSNDTINVGENISQLVHEYSSVGQFTVSITNISSFALTTNNSTWYSTTSQNQYTVKSVISMSSRITSIENYMFYFCRGLISVTIPDSVTSIGGLAFYGCSSLTSIMIPVSVTSIGGSAFEGCSSLTSVTISDSVTSIGGLAFYGCSGLTSVNISDLATWCGISFSNFYANPLSHAKHLFIDGNEIINLAIPSGVANISNHAFYNCSSLTSVTIPDSVTGIGNWAFSSCTSLKDFDFTSWSNIPSSITIDKFSTGQPFYYIIVPDSLYSTWSASASWQDNNGLVISQTMAQKQIPTFSRSTGLTIDIGGTASCGVSTNSTGAVTYTSQNTGIATVSNAGIITGVAGGDTTIIIINVAETSTHRPLKSYISVTVTQEGGAGGECLLAGTMIRLADGTEKPIEDIRESDLLMVWDFDKGEKSAAYPVWVKVPQFKNYYWKNTFESGREILTTGIDAGHRFFDMTVGQFRYNVDCIGHRCMMEDGTVEKLIGVLKINKECEYFNVATFGHMNCYANGILTSTGMNNLYPVDTTTMKYIKDSREIKDISQFPGVSEKWYNGFRYGEQPLAVEYVMRDHDWRYELSMECRRQIPRWVRIKDNKTEARGLADRNNWRTVVDVIVSETEPTLEGFLPMALGNEKPIIPEGKMLAHKYVLRENDVLKTYHLINGPDDPWLQETDNQ